MQVQGRVHIADGRTADDVVLTFHRRGFGGAATSLGTTTTERGGGYAFTVESRTSPVHLEVRALGADGRTQYSLAQATLDAGRDSAKELNLVLPAEARPMPAEYTRLTAALTPHLEGGRLADAQERTGRRDIGLLSRSSRWDARLVALVATAERLSASTGIEPSAVYGMLRAGLPTRAATLAMVSPRAVGHALRRATDGGVVALDPSQIREAQAAFERFAAAARRDMVGPGALSSHGEMLAATGLSAADQDRLDQILTGHRGDDAQLWTAVRDARLPVEKIQLVARLGYLTNNNVPLITALAREIGTLDRLREVLVGWRLYQSAQWEVRLTELARDGAVDQLVPPAFDAPTAAGRLAAYAAHLAGKVRSSYPTHVVADLVRTDHFVLGPGHAEAKDDVATVLDRAAAPGLGFQLGRAPLNAFLRDHADALFAGIPAERVGPTTAHLKTLQRLYQITPSDEAMKVLLDAGFTRASDVAAMPYQKYLKRYGKKFPDEDQARRTYAKAQQGTAIVYAFFGAAKQLAVSPPAQALTPSPAAVQEAKNKLIHHYPTMEELFGSLDFCECDHCRSVLSPAAYLVDILKLTDPDDLDWQAEVAGWPGDHAGAPYPFPNVAEWTAAGKPSPVPPYQALRERRPDLVALPLTCENTHTAMPYIDIVNEIFEYYVVHGHLTADAVHDTGTATTPDLLAEPQHLLPMAYDHLKTATYPLRLPFDLWLETVRRFCDYFDAPLWRILDALRRTDALYPPLPVTYGTAAVALERLGLTGAERAILTRPDALADWQALYGYDPAVVSPATALGTLVNAKALARRLDVSYRDLVALVRTGFVNPRLETLVTLRKLGVDTEDVMRYLNQPGTKPFTPAEHDAFVAKLGPQSLAWAQQAWANGDFGKILVLADPDAACGFENTTLRYADGAPADAMVLVLLNLFVRLRRRLGWSIDELDRALVVFLPSAPDPRTATALGPALDSALLGLARLDALTAALKVGRKGRIQLLPLWSRLDDRRYAELFLTGGAPGHDAVFEQPLGRYLSLLVSGTYQPYHYDGTPENVAAGNVPLAGHLAAVQAALQLSADEVARILDDAGIALADAPLNLTTVSILYRYGLLARLLRISVTDLIFVKALSGLDPFHPPHDGPVTTTAQDHPQTTVRFVETVAAVKASGLSATEMDYLFRHRFDPVGPHRTAAMPPLALARALAAEIARIRAEHAAPTDPLTLTDEVLRQKLALAFPPDVVETFTAMWSGTIEYEAVWAGVAESDQLEPKAFSAVPAITVEYDPDAGEQHLRYRGVLTGPVRADVTAALPPTLPAYVDELLDEVQQQANEFFTRHLRKAFVAGVGEVGFLELADFDLFFSPAPVPQDVDRNRRARFAETFLPYLRERLIRALSVRSAAADVGAEPSLVEALLTDPDLIDDPDVAGRELVEAYAAIGEPGVTTTTTAAGGVRLDGYLEVPATGGYRFSVRCGAAGTSVLLTFDHLTDPLLRVTTATDNLEPSAHTELKAGVPYGFTLEAGPGDDFALLVRGEQLPKGPVDRLTRYPRATMAKLHRVHLLLAKTVQLASALGLTERELRHLLTHADDFDGLDLGELPTRADDDTPQRAQALFGQFHRLVAYTGLRETLGADPDDLVDLLSHARRSFPPNAVPATAVAEVLGDVCDRLARITRRKPATVLEAAGLLDLTAVATPGTDGVDVVAAGFVDERGLGRLWQVLALATKLGVPPAALQRWATPQPDQVVARDIRDTVKARFAPEQWRRVAQPISDALRQRKRDALVAHVTHTGGFERLEQLFEYFLVDPGTEPVVQTSRLRLAISSVQLFIQRCLLGLEVKVHPSVLNSAHWQWMKRYRVWEANRKIFLWPENWLEPEFRDDKTNLFDELEGTLLQTDVSNDSAESAFIGYLRGLEKLARLDIRAIYLEERDDPSSNTLHVLARTYTAPHKYYYRSYAQQMWTPWVPVTADIDGNLATIAVWRGRVHVFWVSFVTKAETTKPAANDTTTAAGMKLTQLAAMAPKLRVRGRLSWTVYFQGEWSEPAGTGYESMSDYLFSDPFDPKDTVIFAEPEPDGPVRVYLYGVVNRSFKLTSVHAGPTMAGTYLPDTPYTGAVKDGSQAANPWVDDVAPIYVPPGLAVNFLGEVTMKGGNLTSGELAHKVILAADGDPDGYQLITHKGQLHGFPADLGPIVAPFFYVDNKNTLFVEPKVTETPIEEGNGLTLPNVFVDSALDHAGHWAAVDVAAQVPGPPPEEGPGPIEVISPEASYALQKSKDWLVMPANVVEFDGTAINATGGLIIGATQKGTS